MSDSPCRYVDLTWAAIPDTEGRFFVASDGRVADRSVDPPRPVIASVSSTGYLQVRLGERVRKVHVLVAEAFLGQRPPGAQVLHNDGDETNPLLSNLRYGTRSENELDKVRHGTHQQARKTACPQGHAYDEENTLHYRGRRYCRTCKREQRNEARRAARRSA